MSLITSSASLAQENQPFIRRYVVMEFCIAVDTAETIKDPATPHPDLINPNEIRIPGNDDLVDRESLPHVRDAWLASIEAAMQPTYVGNRAEMSIEAIAHAVSIQLQTAAEMKVLMERVQGMDFPVPECYSVTLPSPGFSLGLRQEIIEKLIPFVGIRDALQRFDETLDLPIRTLTMRHYDPEQPILAV